MNEIRVGSNGRMILTGENRPSHFAYHKYQHVLAWDRSQTSVLEANGHSPLLCDVAPKFYIQFAQTAL
jgi:hypothetical protein